MRSILSIFFTGKLSVGFLFSAIFDMKCMWGLESNTFKNHKADFIWMLLYCVLGTCILSLLVPAYIIIGVSLRYFILYYWARRNPFFKVSLYFIPLKSTYLPFAMLFVNFILTAEFFFCVLF